MPALFRRTKSTTTLSERKITEVSKKHVGKKLRAKLLAQAQNRCGYFFPLISFDTTPLPHPP
jgi:hypothetical protein